MKNIITKTTELAMEVALMCVEPGDTVVDATCGGGHDTLALAGAAGPEGKVFAFDIQEEAVGLTKERIAEKAIENVQVINGSFVNMESYVEAGSASCIVFNLGYLPGGDHSITTDAETTLQGLEAALRTVKKGGIVTVVLYDGHEEGKREKAQVLKWAEGLDPKAYHVAYVNFMNQPKDPPEILWITKKKD